MDENRQPLLSWLGAGGVPLVADSFGDPAAPPIIYVHGGGQSRYAWRRGAQAAADAGFHAIAIDQRGHGDSGWASDGDYSPGTMASDIQLLARRLARPAILVGASRGGYSTLIAAARADPAVRAIVLVEIAPKIDRSGAEQVRAFMRASAQGFANVQEAAGLLARYMNRPARKDPERLLRSMKRDGEGRLFWRWDPRVAQGASSDPVQMERELEEASKRVSCPVLLVRGERSELVKQEHADHLKSLIPGAQVATIPGAGHMVSGDEYDLFDAAIMKFIGRLAPVEGAVIDVDPARCRPSAAMSAQ